MIKQPSILIVDDNADSRLAVIAALRKKEYLFYEAKDGEEGGGFGTQTPPERYYNGYKHAKAQRLRGAGTS